VSAQYDFYVKYNAFADYSIPHNPSVISIDGLYKVSSSIPFIYNLKYNTKDEVVVDSTMHNIVIDYQLVYRQFVTKFIDKYYNDIINNEQTRIWIEFCKKYCTEFPVVLENKHDWIELLTCIIVKNSAFHSAQHIMLYSAVDPTKNMAFRLRKKFPIYDESLSNFVWKIDIFQHLLFKHTEGAGVHHDKLTEVEYDCMSKNDNNELRSSLAKLHIKYSDILGVEFDVSASTHP